MTNPNDLGVRQSLDYIFECFYKETDNKNEEMVLKVDKKSLQVEKFLIDQNSSKGKKKYSQLSDHFGLSCELIHNGKVSEDLKEENLNEEQRILLDIL